MSTLLLEAGLYPEQMKNKLSTFMDKIQALTDIMQIDLRGYQADHIAMRINEYELAKLAHEAWRSEGKVISTTEINGRPIVVLEFAQALMASEWSIECLELPYPAVGKVYPEQSWEHVEFVVPSTATTAETYLQEIKQIFPMLDEGWDTLIAKGVKTKLSSPKGEGERLNNPTVAFKWNGVCIKIHPHSLKDIIASEHA